MPHEDDGRRGAARAVRRGRGRGAGRLPRRLGAAQPERRRAGALPRHGRHATSTTSSSTSPWSAPGRRAGDRRLCGLGRPAGGRAGLPGLRRPGRRQRAHRELPGLSDRHLGPGAGRPGLRAGAEVRRRDADPGAGASLDCSAPRPTGELSVHLTDGRRLRARTVVIASGARYRRPAVPRLGEFEGRGVWYWASAIEAKMCARSRGGAGRRRQLGRAGGGVPGAARRQGLHAGARPGPGGQHVALPDRPHRGHAATSSCCRTPS